MVAVICLYLITEIWRWLQCFNGAHCNVDPGFRVALRQNPISWLSMPRISKLMHCEIFFKIPYFQLLLFYRNWIWSYERTFRSSTPSECRWALRHERRDSCLLLMRVHRVWPREDNFYAMVCKSDGRGLWRDDTLWRFRWNWYNWTVPYSRWMWNEMFIVSSFANP